MNFKVGDKVVCIVPNNVGWSDENGNEVIAPCYDEILEIDFIHKESRGLYLGFYKYNAKEGYNSEGFRKLDYDFAEKVLEITKEEAVSTLN